MAEEVAPAAAQDFREAHEACSGSDADYLLKERLAGCTAIIAMGPSRFLYNAYVNRAGHYALSEDYERAIADLNEAIRLEPGTAIAFKIRGLIETVLGRKAEAAVDLARAKAIDPAS